MWHLSPRSSAPSRYRKGGLSHNIRIAAGGFSLVELLVVVGIIALLMALAVPAFNSITGGQRIGRAINNVAGFLETARAEAMARNSYVYVGFQNATGSDNNSELRIGAVISADGTNNTLETNLKPLSKLVKIANVQTTDFEGLPDALKTYIESSASDLKTNSNYVATKSGCPKFTISDQSFEGGPYILFAPEGEIVAGASGLMFQTLVSVGLSPTRGTTVQTSAMDGAVVTAYGGSAKLRITRP